jgi:hypothetical protein
MAAVPSHWYKNGKFAWPKMYIENKSKLIKKRLAANNLEFDYFSARKLLTENPIGNILL